MRMKPFPIVHCSSPFQKKNDVSKSIGVDMFMIIKRFGQIDASPQRTQNISVKNSTKKTSDLVPPYRNSSPEPLTFLKSINKTPRSSQRPPKTTLLDVTQYPCFYHVNEAVPLTYKIRFKRENDTNDEIIF